MVSVFQTKSKLRIFLRTKINIESSYHKFAEKHFTISIHGLSLKPLFLNIEKLYAFKIERSRLRLM